MRLDSRKHYLKVIRSRWHFLKPMQTHFLMETNLPRGLNLSRVTMKPKDLNLDFRSGFPRRSLIYFRYARRSLTGTSSQTEKVSLTGSNLQTEKENVTRSDFQKPRQSDFRLQMPKRSEIKRRSVRDCPMVISSHLDSMTAMLTEIRWLMLI